MTRVITATIAILLVTQTDSGFAQEQENTKVKALAKKIDAALVSNTYVHYSKGIDAHCLYDPIKKNAVSLTVFQNLNTNEVKLSTPSKDIVLRSPSINRFRIDKIDYYAICKNDKVIVANTKTGQTGLIVLTKPKKK